MRDDATIGVDERPLDDEALEALADAHAAAPPARLRVRLLAEARRDRDSRRTAGALRRWRIVGSIAAAVALAFAALTSQQAREQARIAQQRTVELSAAARANDELAARLDAQERTLAGLRDAVASQAQVLRIVAGARTLTAALAAQQGAGGGRVVVDATSGEGAIVLTGLDPVGPERTYELWAIRGKRPPEPAGVFTVERGQPLAARVAPVARPREVTAFAVSIEPAGGSPKPTGPIVLAGATSS